MNLLKEMKGQIFTEVKVIDNEELIFTSENGEVFCFYHEQDCCESVYIEDVCGDLNDLVDSPLLVCDESTNQGDYDWGTATWTFYKFATIKGYVDVRWVGSSNGYYSEAVYIKKLEGDK